RSGRRRRGARAWKRQPCDVREGLSSGLTRTAAASLPRFLIVLGWFACGFSPHPGAGSAGAARRFPGHLAAPTAITAREVNVPGSSGHIAGATLAHAVRFRQCGRAACPQVGGGGGVVHSRVLSTCPSLADDGT